MTWFHIFIVPSCVICCCPSALKRLGFNVSRIVRLRLVFTPHRDPVSLMMNVKQKLKQHSQVLTDRLKYDFKYKNSIHSSIHSLLPNFIWYHKSFTEAHTWREKGHFKPKTLKNSFLNLKQPLWNTGHLKSTAKEALFMPNKSSMSHKTHLFELMFPSVFIGRRESKTAHKWTNVGG